MMKYILPVLLFLFIGYGCEKSIQPLENKNPVTNSR